MREALARSSNDFLVAEPRRKKPAPRKSAFSTLAAIARFIRGLASYPNRIAGALLVAMAVAITVNALELQTARHPAPLFGRETAPRSVPAPRPAAIPALSPHMATQPAPAPPAINRGADPLGRFIRQGEVTTTAKAAAPVPVARPDAISQIIRNSAPASAAKELAPNRTILAVQRALVKLGFVLRADGIDGEATRKALVQYEADHHLPAHGELTPKVIREISAEAHVAIP